VQGTDLMKHGRHGKPKVHYFRLAESDTHLTWRSAKGNQRGVVLTMVKQVCCHCAPLLQLAAHCLLCCHSILFCEPNINPEFADQHAMAPSNGALSL